MHLSFVKLTECPSGARIVIFQCEQLSQPNPYHTLNTSGLSGVCVCLSIDGGPDVTALTSASGSVLLRCAVHFNDVVRNNAYVTWHKSNGDPMPLVTASAMSATTLSPGCKSPARRRRRRRNGNNDRKRAAGSAQCKCKVMWDQPKAFIPNRLYMDFITLAASENAPQLELCVTTGSCGHSK